MKKVNKSKKKGGGYWEPTFRTYIPPTDHDLSDIDYLLEEDYVHGKRCEGIWNKSGGLWTEY